jgi:O-acetyl-ADP-ribose deacetylase (regulator of RNase III)
MKIIYKKGDVTEASEDAIVHGCNAQGVMGSGVAAAIRTKFPEAYQTYRNKHEKFGLMVGELVPGFSNGKTIVNAITQQDFGTHRRQVDYEGIYKALETLNLGCIRAEITAVAFPRIGAGLGGGNWRVIEAMIEETSTNYQPVVYDL